MSYTFEVVLISTFSPVIFSLSLSQGRTNQPYHTRSKWRCILRHRHRRVLDSRHLFGRRLPRRPAVRVRHRYGGCDLFPAVSRLLRARGHAVGPLPTVHFLSLPGDRLDSSDRADR